MKQKTNLRYTFKINSSRLRKNKWSLNLTIEEAIENEELIALADSQALRFIADINKRSLSDINKEANDIKDIIKDIKKQKTTAGNKKLIKQLYSNLYDTLFVKDYVNIVVDKNTDFDRMNGQKGFYINGVKFKRLLATPGGSKKSTVVYVSESIHNELVKRIDNGRDTSKKFVPAKLEAYRALTCSSSISVSDPEGVLVVDDCETNFKANVIEIDDTKTEYPLVLPKKDYPITLNESDGYGIISPELSKKWAEELGESYTPSALIVRGSFLKGSLMCFDFQEFSEKIAKNNIVIDAWKKPRDITKVQIVLTTSMLKLWDSYKSIEHYLECCKENGYTFSITKMSPKELENERNLNYQFIQSLDLLDSDIEELIKPTVDEIKDIMGNDWAKSLLYLKGTNMDENSFDHEESSYIKALMINKDMIHDPFIKSKIKGMINKRINQAKVGVLKVKGNFSIVSGDPYSLCQSMFKMKVTGLLQANEYYSKYWNDRGIDKVAAFRAPMTCHNNIRVLRLKNTEEMQKWYQYMNTVTILNSWDTVTHAENGMDKDGDTLLTTDNPVILRSIKELDAILCVQKTIDKDYVDESKLIQANKNSFGDQIGNVTNKITSMFDIMPNFPKDSLEYKQIEHRIMCGQNYQQNAIDKTKGIESKSMPREWYDYHAIMKLPEDKREFNLRIMADKKPYFFIYIYPHLRKAYNTHTKSYEQKSISKFKCDLGTLLSKEELTDEESQFVQMYYRRSPVTFGKSVMNKICWSIEDEFNRTRSEKDNYKFPKNMLKNHTRYSKKRYLEIRELYKEYCNFMKDRSVGNKIAIEEESEGIGRDIVDMLHFTQESFKICPNEEELSNIMVDLCFKSNSTKKFMWDICGEQIVSNLLNNSDNQSFYVRQDESGEIEFQGLRFTETVKNH